MATAAAANAQAGPTVVWYGTYGGNYASYIGGAILRAWSDGTVEIKFIRPFLNNEQGTCGSDAPCSSPWLPISSPSQGFRAAADINADELVDGADLATVLGNWGDAPPSDCPLNLINP